MNAQAQSQFGIINSTTARSYNTIDITFTKMQKKTLNSNLLRMNNLVQPDIVKRSNKAYEKWLNKNDNSLEWNDWARKNPNRARDICLEAEYFYRKGKKLPSDWSVIAQVFVRDWI